MKHESMTDGAFDFWREHLWIIQVYCSLEQFNLRDHVRSITGLSHASQFEPGQNSRLYCVVARIVTYSDKQSSFSDKSCGFEEITACFCTV